MSGSTRIADLLMRGAFGAVFIAAGSLVLAFATWRIMPNGQLMSRGIAAIVLVSSATLVAPVWGARPGVIKYSNGSVVLHPSGWLGYSFPLGSDLELAERLGAGKWQLLFVSAGCPKCEQSLKDSAKNDAVDYETILIAVPHGPNAEHEYRWSGEIAHLSPKLNWIVRTPMSVIVEEGIVSRVSFH